ncbi:hypothetical protein ACJEBK_28520 [Peribacillus frigoritolerans]|uniref:hypothetical protein n=1 Tax=Peribacillus frigoritolerans TaxID=450367 RepID=UPI0038711E0E
MKDLFGKLESVYEKIYDEVYAEAEPPQQGKVLQPKIPRELLQELSEVLTEINEVLNSDIISDILDKIEEGGTIDKLSEFDIDKCKEDYFNSNPEQKIDVDALDKDATDVAYDKETSLLDNARGDVEELIDDLLPTLLRK